MKKAEFDIRQKAEDKDQLLSLSATDQGPASQRTNIDEYFRAIAKKP
jgi:hypothetical protein